MILGRCTRAGAVVPMMTSVFRHGRSFHPSSCWSQVAWIVHRRYNGNYRFKGAMDSQSGKDMAGLVKPNAEYCELALVDSELRELIRDGLVGFDLSLKDSLDYVQPASIDIPIGSECYLLKEKVLPFGKDVVDVLENIVIEKRFIDRDDGVVLLKGQSYLIKCGRIALAPNQRGSLSPKSSIGRVDLMVRGILDQCGLYDTIVGGTEGDLWMEISPRSFNVRVKRGLALSQLMVFQQALQSQQSNTDDPIPPQQHQSLLETEDLIYSRDGQRLEPHQHRGALVLSLSLDHDMKQTGFEAIPTNEVIDLSKVGYHDPKLFFRPIQCQGGNTITLEKDKFYILATKERISVPVHLSAEMIPFSQHVGELRAHYAGFFDPGFGYGRHGEIKGTVGVLEVRPHETITVYDGQPICLMDFFRNSKPPSVPYGMAGNNYQAQQGPKLAKFFKDVDQE